jgi:hypothetical protein
VSPTAITTGPTPELPDDDPALAMICRPDIASRYRWLDVTSPRSSRDQANRTYGATRRDSTSRWAASVVATRLRRTGRRGVLLNRA